METPKPYSHPRWWDDPKPKDIQCNFCKHSLGRGKCEAFKDGIPRALKTVEITHDKPYPGDNGILFERGTPEYRAKYMAAKESERVKTDKAPL
jgi:hypothetical protein